MFKWLFKKKKNKKFNCQLTIKSSPSVCRNLSCYSPDYFSRYNTAVSLFDKKHGILLKKNLIDQTNYSLRRHYYSLEQALSYNKV